MNKTIADVSANSGESDAISVPGALNVGVQNLGAQILLNPAVTNVPLAPYLYISVIGKAGKGNELNRPRLDDYLRRIVGAAVEAQSPTWEEFAADNYLMVGDQPITTPGIWFIGKMYWVTITWQSEYEAHIHFGFVYNNQNKKKTHLTLANHTKNWLSNISSYAKAKWWNISGPTVEGEANIIGYDTGIKVKPRQTFVASLKSKDSAMTAAAVCVPCIGFLIKNYQPTGSFHPMVPHLVIAIGCLIGTTLLTTIIRHFFALPPFSWGVAELEE